jgi:hypothetical protein
MKTDLWFRRHQRWFEQGEEFLVDITQCAVVQEQGFVDLSEALKDGGVGDLVLAEFHESPNDVDAHGDCARTVEDGRRHKGAMLGEGVRRILAVPSATGP